MSVLSSCLRWLICLDTGDNTPRALAMTAFTLQSAMQLRSVVQQVALTLAVGEAALQFEHRALSASQVLVRGEHDQVLSFWLDGRILFVDSFGLQASLVDFSVARAQPPGEHVPPQ
ncbi:hypothetical protein HPB48_020924 [Haemaphysalis longicornis]|uniref:Uncharacterized protein n=1 Tax=Haemaphysalis longicornis TaxID=44386 RepID=A0A9J6GUU1_HAELO|nr:hypothetical protein HPB48_020924 [Haemaphysalis longicornis]